MIKLTFQYHVWFSQDLCDAVEAFDSFADTDQGKRFVWQLKRWAYTPNSAKKMYRKTVVIEREGYPTEVMEWHCKEGLESIISELIYENEEV